MTNLQMLSIAGGFAGAVGSIVTVFCLNGVVMALKNRDERILAWVKNINNSLMKVSNDINIGGIDRSELEQASVWGSRLAKVGIVFLVVGFIFQAICIFAVS